jgi:hypothetical protein
LGVYDDMNVNKELRNELTALGGEVTGDVKAKWDDTTELLELAFSYVSSATGGPSLAQLSAAHSGWTDPTSTDTCTAM